jgi:oligopeptide transport system substrate-binding protein
VQVIVKYTLLGFSLVVTLFAITSCKPKTDSNDVTAGELRPSEIRRGLGGEPETLDTVQAADNAALAVAGDLFEGLTTEASDGSIIAGAAQRWTVTPDGLGWTFHLRPGLRWSNGEALTARDFVRALDEVRDAASTAPYASLLESVTLARATDDATIELFTTRPMPQLTAILALPFAAPRYAGSPTPEFVSNGPYRLLARTSGDSLQLERNPHFHDADSVAIAQVRYLTVADLGTELNLYRAGDLDITSEVPNAQIDWIRRNLPGELHVTPFLSTYGYARRAWRWHSRSTARGS